jgi:hypothetical protein
MWGVHAPVSTKAKQGETQEPHTNVIPQVKGVLSCREFSLVEPEVTRVPAAAVGEGGGMQQVVPLYWRQEGSRSTVRVVSNISFQHWRLWQDPHMGQLGWGAMGMVVCVIWEYSWAAARQHGSLIPAVGSNQL